jgi:hypothetical protein
MGVSVHYWAVPPSSTLSRRLQSDKGFVTLWAALCPYTNWLDEIPPAELEALSTCNRHFVDASLAVKPRPGA